MKFFVAHWRLKKSTSDWGIKIGAHLQHTVSKPPNQPYSGCFSIRSPITTNPTKLAGSLMGFGTYPSSLPCVPVLSCSHHTQFLTTLTVYTRSYPLSREPPPLCGGFPHKVIMFLLFPRGAPVLVPPHEAPSGAFVGCHGPGRHADLYGPPAP